jgi:hypothetical protein
MKHPKYKDVWTKSFSAEIRCLAPTTETIFFHQERQESTRRAQGQQDTCVGTKTRKFPLPVMDMPVRLLESVRVMAHALTNTGIHMYGCIIIRMLFCFSYHFTYLPP